MSEEKVETWLSSMPVWAKLVATLGLPTVLVAVLLGVLLGIVPSPLLKVVPMFEYLVEHETRRKGSDEEQSRLLRQICRNVAKSEFNADACNR